MKSGNATRRSQSDRRRATREALLAAAVESICELGFAGATGARIAARAGVTRGAVQHHFESRDDLILAVIDRVATLNVSVDLDALERMPFGRRMDALVSNYHAVYTSREFRAALHIWLGAAKDAVLFDRLRTRIAVAERELASIWDRVFVDLGASEEAVQSARHLVLGAIRGHAIEDLFGLESDWPHYSVVLREAALDRIGSRQGVIRGG